MLKHEIFGESHGPAIGVVLTGVPAGLVLDMEFIQSELTRRAPGTSAMSTARREADTPRILSGVFEGKTTGAPLCAVIENTDTRSKDYGKIKDLPRPSHGDFTGFVASGGCNDYRGGGHFSGRLTAPLVFAGAVAKLLLRPRGVTITALIQRAAGIETPTPGQLEEAVLAARAQEDSVGGILRGTVSGLPAGLGAPDFGENAEGIFAQYLFAVPAVKGISFGAGFGLADMRGSEANDPFYLDGGRVKTATNHSGGINGGITNGMDVVFDVVIRPTPSISKPQRTVNLRTMEETELVVEGRHDPCILHRALPVIEGAAALAVCRLMNL
ncbi:MAG: Chorismate synthase [Oscillospiraceae bacterium]|nr:Chorismate synthase [Oscillospiraceae bacterium]